VLTQKFILIKTNFSIILSINLLCLWNGTSFNFFYKQALAFNKWFCWDCWNSKNRFVRTGVKEWHIRLGRRIASPHRNIVFHWRIIWTSQSFSGFVFMFSMHIIKFAEQSLIGIILISCLGISRIRCVVSLSPRRWNLPHIDNQLKKVQYLLKRA